MRGFAYVNEDPAGRICHPALDEARPKLHDEGFRVRSKLRDFKVLRIEHDFLVRPLCVLYPKIG